MLPHVGEIGVGGEVEGGEGSCASRLPRNQHKSLTDDGVGQSFIVQELCESRGGRPGLSVLTSLLVSVDVKNY